VLGAAEDVTAIRTFVTGLTDAKRGDGTAAPVAERQPSSGE
jgi:hypothetical protein